MKKRKKWLSLVIAAALSLSLAGTAFASGEASGEASGGAGFANFDVNDLAATAAVSVIGGAIAADDAVQSGIIAADRVTGVWASYDGIGDWDGTAVFGHSGLILSSESDDVFTVGGEKDIYEVDGQGYNTVIILGAEDKDEPNALGGGDTRDYKDASEGAEGAGVYADVKNLVIDNAYIFTEGYGRSAVHLKTTTEQSVIKDSTIIALGSDGADSSAPGIICMYASSRPVLIESSGNTYFYNDDLISSDWGVYSLDGCYGANVYIVDSYSENTVGGYSMYALGFTPGEENSTYFYGSYAASAQYGTILCAAGRTYTGALSDAADDVLAQLGDDALADTVLENGWSYIGGNTNAVTMQADMSSADTVGILDATHTVFDTAGVATRDGELLADTMDLYDYKDDAGVGAAHYFLSYIHGAAFAIRSENVDLTLDDCLVTSSNGVAIQSVIGFDGMANGIRVSDGDEYYGINAVIKDMTLDGDILHEDYQRKMILTLENASLNGAVVSGTYAAWRQNLSDFIDAGWDSRDEELGHDKDTVLAELCYDEGYETIWGVRMSMDADSVWTVTGDSSLNTLTLEDGAQIQAAAGQTLEIYVGCDMNGSDTFYDYTTGTQVDSLSAGEYTGVVILVK